jgi:putative nucleotidyltransferase with HDIG domain
LGRQVADALGGHLFTLGQDRMAARVLLPDRELHIDLLLLEGELEADLRRRDYTVDGMAAPLAEAAAGGRVAFIDPCGGRSDLDRRLVRAVSEEAFRRDPLRLLRGVRLCAELGFSLEPTTVGLIRRHAHRLPVAAAERQRDELVRILASPSSARHLRLLDDLGLLGPLLPELEVTRGVEQPKEHYWDVFHHLLETVAALDMLLCGEAPKGRRDGALWRELWGQLPWLDLRTHFRQEVVAGLPRVAVLKLAALLHDIAKPQTKSLDEKGRIRFFGHQDLGADMAADAAGRLRFPARAVEMVRILLASHLRPVQLGQSASGGPSRRALYRLFRDAGETLIELLVLTLADHLATAGPRADIDDWRAHVSLINYMLMQRYQEEALVSPPRLVSGHDLMAELGLAPGPMVGQLREAIREAQAAGEVVDREGALALARRRIAAGVGGRL